MTEQISKTTKRVQRDIPKANSPSTSTAINPTLPSLALGKPDCPYCQGVGFVRWDVPLGHEKFGKIELCVCRSVDRAEKARNRLYALSSLERLSHLSFENFQLNGNSRSKETIQIQELESLHQAWEFCQKFARDLQGWILLEGPYGCGKTHLAAAIANDVVTRGVPTLFITVPDLLDSLRFAYNSPETTFEARFEDIRSAALLVMDDFGTHNATSWAQEKLFQIINYRYINKLPTVLTTNLILDEIESRIRSRLQDDEFVRRIRISAPDYRRPNETGNPGLSMLSVPEIKKMTFLSFETREDEIGKEIATVVTTEKTDKFGNPVKDKVITREKITSDHIKKLIKAVTAAFNFAEKPQGWLILLGQSFCGKTHLAAAIGNHRQELGGEAILTDVSVLLDYLKETFRPNSDVSFDRRFHEIRTTPLLMLDNFKESGATSVWAEDKLHQILNHRYYAGLPTVITSTLDPDSFARNYPNLWNKILDPTKCQVCSIDMPPYRRQPEKPKKVVSLKKK